MTLATADVVGLLSALTAILIAAHGVGAAFAKVRQPRVIGEIVGGLVLGPTVLGAWAPGTQQWLFTSHGSTASVLAAVYQLGLLLLMYCSGIELQSAIRRDEARAAACILLVGTLVPFLAGILALRLIDEGTLVGPHGNKASFLLVFAIAMAVTSIPVISRIMLDLGIMGTPFSRIVLGVAVVEDVVLYVVLAVALGVSSQSPGALYGLPMALGVRPGSEWDLAYHAAATIGVLAGFVLLGRPIYRASAALRFNLIRQGSPVAYQLIFMLAACLTCLLLGIQPFFGAFAAGIVVGTASAQSNPVEEGATVAIKQFAFAFFIPIYFALVGLQLDLLHQFSLLFFVGYLLFACLVKTVSVYGGARLGGQPSGAAVNLAVAMNARGGPGIVVASVAFSAGIINQSFYAVLVLLAVVTSLIAGSWLQRIPRDRLLASHDQAHSLDATPGMRD